MGNSLSARPTENEEQAIYPLVYNARSDVPGRFIFSYSEGDVDTIQKCIESVGQIPDHIGCTLIFPIPTTEHKFELGDNSGYKLIKDNKYLILSNIGVVSDDNSFRVDRHMNHPLIINKTDNSMICDAAFKDNKFKLSSFVEGNVFSEPVFEGMTEASVMYIDDQRILQTSNKILDTDDYIVHHKMSDLKKDLCHIRTLANKERMCVVYDTTNITNQTEKTYLNEVIKKMVPGVVKNQNYYVLRGTISGSIVTYKDKKMSLVENTNTDFQIKSNKIEVNRLISGVVVDKCIVQFSDLIVELFSTIPDIHWSSAKPFTYVHFKITIKQMKALVVLLNDNTNIKYSVYIDFKLDTSVTDAITEKKLNLVSLSNNRYIMHNLDVKGSDVFLHDVLTVKFSDNSIESDNWDIHVFEESVTSVFKVTKTNDKTYPLVKPSFPSQNISYLDIRKPDIPSTLEPSRFMLFVLDEEYPLNLYTRIKLVKSKTDKFAILTKTNLDKLPPQFVRKALSGDIFLYHHISLTVGDIADRFVIKHGVQEYEVSINNNQQPEQDELKLYTEYTHKPNTLEVGDIAYDHCSPYVIGINMETNMPYFWFESKLINAPSIDSNITKVMTNDTNTICLIKNVNEGLLTDLWSGCEEYAKINANQNFAVVFETVKKSSLHVGNAWTLKRKVGTNEEEYYVVIYHTSKIKVTSIDNSLILEHLHEPTSNTSKFNKISISVDKIGSIADHVGLHLLDVERRQSIHMVNDWRIKSILETSLFTNISGITIIFQETAESLKIDTNYFTSKKFTTIVAFEETYLKTVQRLLSFPTTSFVPKAFCLVIKLSNNLHISNIEDIMSNVCDNTKSAFTNTNYFEKENIVVLSNDSLNRTGNNILAFKSTLFNLGLAKKEKLKKEHILINFKNLTFEQTSNNMASVVSSPVFRLKFLPGFEDARIITPNQTCTATMPIIFLQQVTQFELESIITLMKQSDNNTKNLLIVIIQPGTYSGIETNGLQAYKNVIALYNTTYNPIISFEFIRGKVDYIRVEYRTKYDNYFYKFGIPSNRNPHLFNEKDVEDAKLDFMLSFNTLGGIPITNEFNIITNVKENRVTTSQSWVKLIKINDSYFHKLYNYVNSTVPPKAVVFIKEFIHPSLSNFFPNAKEIYVHVEISNVMDNTYPAILELLEQISRDKKITAIMVTHRGSLNNVKPPQHIMSVHNATTEYSSDHTYSKNDVIFYPTPHVQETNKFKFKTDTNTLFVTDKSPVTTPHFKILKNVVDPYAMKSVLVPNPAGVNKFSFRYATIGLIFLNVYSPDI